MSPAEIGREVAQAARERGIKIVAASDARGLLLELHPEVSGTGLFSESLQSTRAAYLNGQAADGDDPPSAVNWSAFWRRERAAADWLIEPFVPRNRGVALYSPAGEGKSELILALVAGAVILDGLRVVYLDLEMTEDDLHDRLIDLGYGPEHDLSRLAYYLLPDLAALDTSEGGATVREIAASHNADLVVIDTLGRSVQGPENDSDTLRGFFRHTGRLLKLDGRAFLRLDHAGKDVTRGQRGTSGKRDDVDIVWRLQRRQGGVRLKAEKRRSSWVPERVDLVRINDPTVRYRIATSTWPEGTTETVALLDQLDVPLDTGRDKTRHILREAGHGVRNEVLAAALRWRRERAGTGAGTGPSENPGTGAGDRSRETGSDQGGDRSGDRWGQVPSPIGDNPVPPIGGQVSQDPEIDAGICAVCDQPDDLTIFAQDRSSPIHADCAPAHWRTQNETETIF